MILFDSEDSIQQQGLPPPLEAYLLRRFRDMSEQYEQLGSDYDLDSDGPFALLQDGEETEELEAILCPRLAKMVFEYVEYCQEAECFFAVYIPSNSWAASLFVPDGDGLDATVRAHLVESLSPIGDGISGHAPGESKP